MRLNLKLWLAVALAVSQPGGLMAQRPAEDPQIDIRPFVARKIADHVHLLTTPDDFFAFSVSNVLLIEQKDGFVAIDSGLTAAHGRAIVRFVQSLSEKPIKAVAITHWHNDHPQGVSAIRDAFPKVHIIATRATEEAMLGPEAYDVGYSPNARADAAVEARVKEVKDEYRKILDDPATQPDRKLRVQKALTQFDDYLRDFPGTYIVPPNETFERRLVLDDPEFPVHLLFLGRANTAGDLVAWLPRQSLLETGDIVVEPIPFGFGSFPADWIRTLHRIKSLKYKILIPGHGKPQTDTPYISDLAAAIGEIRAKVGPLARRGLSLEEVQKTVVVDGAALRFGTTPRAAANFKALFVDPMIANAFKEARGEPIIQGEGSPPARFTEPGPKSNALRHGS